MLVMHEVTNGPFHKEKTVLASFAPLEKDENAAREYLENLSIAVDKFENSNFK